jgi:hypothetical protein
VSNKLHNDWLCKTFGVKFKSENYMLTNTRIDGMSFTVGIALNNDYDNLIDSIIINYRLLPEPFSPVYYYYIKQFPNYFKICDLSNDDNLIYSASDNDVYDGYDYSSGTSLWSVWGFFGENVGKHIGSFVIGSYAGTLYIAGLVNNGYIHRIMYYDNCYIDIITYLSGSNSSSVVNIFIPSSSPEWQIFPSDLDSRIETNCCLLVCCEPDKYKLIGS